MKFLDWLEKHYFKVLFLGLFPMFLWSVLVTQMKIIVLNSESVPFRVCVQVYNLKPEKGELCAFNFKGQTFVKYMVGVAGDEIKNFKGTIYVGTTKVGKAKRTKLLSPIPEGKIPEGYVFMAGTHPDSLDSRYKEVGLIPVADIKGKAFGVLAAPAND